MYVNLDMNHHILKRKCKMASHQSICGWLYVISSKPICRLSTGQRADTVHILYLD